MATQTQPLKQHRLTWMLALQLAALIMVGVFFLSGGDDLYNFYLPFAKGDLNAGFVPYFALWVLAPLRWVPDALAWPLLTLVSLAILLAACRVTRANPLWLLLSFPTLALLWLGQIDAVVIAGLVIAFAAPNPWVRGIGLTLAAIKPQLAGLAIIVLALEEDWRDWPKLFAVPMGAAALSFAVFGLDWPLRWLENASAVPVHAYNIGIVDPSPYLFAPLIWVFRTRQLRLQTALFVAVAASPYYGLYSYTVPLAFGVPWWAAVVSYVWPVAFTFGNDALRVAWIVPLVVLVPQYIAQERAAAPADRLGARWRRTLTRLRVSKS